MQCPDTAKPPGGVSERKKNRTDKQEEENKGMDPNGEDRQKVSHVKKVLKMGETEAERQREEKNGERVIRETSACW